MKTILQAIYGFMTGKAIRKLIPNGRKLIYGHDTKELLAWDEELLR